MKTNDRGRSFSIRKTSKEKYDKYFYTYAVDPDFDFLCDDRDRILQTCKMVRPKRDEKD